MLVVSNGVIKSGSSWLMLIAQRLIDVDELPEGFQDPAWSNSALKRDLLKDFLTEGHAYRNNYLVKNHFAVPGERNAMLFYPWCKVIMTFRDVRDSVVSRYFHHMRAEEVPSEGTFHEFFWAPEPPNGRQTLEYLAQYASTWNVEDESLWKVRYEDLHADVGSAVRSLATFLDVDTATVDLDEIIRVSQPRAVTDSAGTGHIRTGRPGDWHNHLGERELELIDEMVPQDIRQLVLRDD